MTTEHRVTVSTPSPTEIEVRREFDATAQLVWDAHTKPEHLRRWLLGPDGWSMPVCEVDLRVGGRYRYEWAHPEHPGFGTGGTFTEVQPVSRLVTTERMDGFEGEAINTLTLTESEGRTTMTQRMRFGSEEARDGALASGMTDGMGQSYDRLERQLAAPGAGH